MAALVVYHNSLDGAFIFDDKPSILENPALHHLDTTLLENREAASTLLGRPILRLSLWANYALGGEAVRGYHALNLTLHILTAFALWGLVRRILESPRLHDRYARASWGLAFAIALLWTVHPLQTESVDYVVQRAEILGGLFYLLTLYGVVRSISSIGWRKRLWYIAAFLLCVVGLASKETVATAPLAAVAMDRVFFAQSWRTLARERGWFYVTLAGSWALLAMLMRLSHWRMGSAGFGLEMTWWEYALTQPYYLCRYLWLSVWPSALTFDYGEYLAHTAGEVVPYAATVLLLLSLTILALWRKPALGFCGFWFFLVLAPTSTILPIVTQTGAEHRMYLSLAGFIGLCVVGGYALWQRVSPCLGVVRSAAPGLFLGIAVTALAARTVVRNQDYRSDRSIWQSVVKQWPANSRAHYNLGNALAKAGRPDEARAHYEEAVRLVPDYAEAHNSLGVVLQTLGRVPEAIAQYGAALRLQPDFAEAHLNLGISLASSGHLPDAIAQFWQALQLKPEFPEAHLNLGTALASSGRLPEAIAQYEEALRLQPDIAGGRLPEAIAELMTEIQQRQQSPLSAETGAPVQK